MRARWSGPALEVGWVRAKVLLLRHARYMSLTSHMCLRERRSQALVGSCSAWQLPPLHCSSTLDAPVTATDATDKGDSTHALDNPGAGPKGIGSSISGIKLPIECGKKFSLSSALSFSAPPVPPAEGVTTAISSSAQPGPALEPSSPFGFPRGEGSFSFGGDSSFTRSRRSVRQSVSKGDISEGMYLIRRRTRPLYASNKLHLAALRLLLCLILRPNQVSIPLPTHKPCLAHSTEEPAHAHTRRTHLTRKCVAEGRSRSTLPCMT